MLLAAALLLASQAVQTVPAKAVVLPHPGRSACATQLVQTAQPAAKLDRPVEGGVERHPYAGERPYLVSAVDRTVDGCSAPVIRVRSGDIRAVEPVKGKSDR